MRKGTVVVSLALFVLAIAYWFMADAIPASRLAGKVGADGLPKLLGVALGGLSLLLAAQTLLEMRRDRATAAPVAKAAQEEKSEKPKGGHLRALGLVGIGVVYLLLLPHLGYLVSSMLLLGAVSIYAGLKPSLKALMFAVIGGIAFYLIFVKLLQIPLPAGFWPSLLG